MADYYSHNDPTRTDARQRFEYEDRSGSGWIWGGILAVALIALMALALSGGGDGTGADGTAPAAMAPADTGSVEAPGTGSTLEAAPAMEQAAPADAGTTVPAGN